MRIPTSYQIIDAWETALASDAALAAWCLSEAEKSLTLFKGVDPRELPKKGDAPYVALVPMSDSVGLASDSAEISVRVICGLASEKGGRTQAGSRVAFETVRSLDREFAPLVLNALAATAYPPDQVEGEFWTDEFPLVEKSLTATVTVPLELDGDRRW